MIFSLHDFICAGLVHSGLGVQLHCSQLVIQKLIERERKDMKDLLAQATNKAIHTQTNQEKQTDELRRHQQHIAMQVHRRKGENKKIEWDNEQM